MRLYTGIDLHSSNSYLAIIDETGKRVFKKKYPNDPEQILSALAPYKDTITGIVIESTYNWYWLVDLLMAEDTRCISPTLRRSRSIRGSSIQMINMMPSGWRRCCGSGSCPKATFTRKKIDRSVTCYENEAIS